MAAKTIPDPTANTMAMLNYARNASGGSTSASTLVGTYRDQGAVFTSTPVTSSGIDAAIDAVLALILVTPLPASASLHVQIDIADMQLVVDFAYANGNRRGRIEINAGFGAALVTAARNVFTQAFAAGMQAALGF